MTRTATYQTIRTAYDSLRQAVNSYRSAVGQELAREITWVESALAEAKPVAALRPRKGYRTEHAFGSLTDLVADAEALIAKHSPEAVAAAVAKLEAKHSAPRDDSWMRYQNFNAATGEITDGGPLFPSFVKA